MKFGAVFLALLVLAGLNAARRPRPAPPTALPARAIDNERLTAVIGALLLVLFVALAVTLLIIRPLLQLHFVVGFALLPPLTLKLGTTGFRFVKYYARDADFRVAGPPPPFERFVVAPSLVVSTVSVMATGIELWAFGDRFGGWWVTAHTVTAVIFMGAVFAHLLSHSRRSAEAVIEDAAVRPATGAITRRSILLGCVILGCVLAAASLAYATPFGSFGGA